MHKDIKLLFTKYYIDYSDSQLKGYLVCYLSQIWSLSAMT